MFKVINKNDVSADTPVIDANNKMLSLYTSICRQISLENILNGSVKTKGTEHYLRELSKCNALIIQDIYSDITNHFTATISSDEDKLMDFDPDAEVLVIDTFKSTRNFTTTEMHIIGLYIENVILMHIFDGNKSNSNNNNNKDRQYKDFYVKFETGLDNTLKKYLFSRFYEHEFRIINKKRLLFITTYTKSIHM